MESIICENSTDRRATHWGISRANKIVVIQNETIGITPRATPPMAKRRSRIVPPYRWILHRAIPPNTNPRIPSRLLGIRGRGSVQRVKRDMEKLAMASQLRGGDEFSVTQLL
jgi:hypothetical protein